MKKNAKHTAAISLGVMGAGFLATFPIAKEPFGYVLQSGFEAGLVGGLADWFAVTALFRHPLGLPIPHTALLPKNREKVTDALVNAIQTNLLNKESILEKMRAANVAEKLLDKLREELASPAAGEKLAAMANRLLDAISPESVAAAVAPFARDAIRAADASALLAAIGREALERRFEETIFDYALSQGERIAVSPDMRRRLGAMALRSIEQAQLGGFMGFAVNAFAGFMTEDKLGGMLQDFLISMLYDMRRPGQTHREAALEAMRRTIRELPDNERVAAEAESLKQGLADGERLERALAALAEKALEALRARFGDPDYCRRAAIPYAERRLEAFAARKDWIERIDEWIRKQAAALVENNHDKIGKLVKENADKLDNETLIAMMEQHVGKDLQWIRVNGAVCGFAIGIVLGVVQRFAIGW